MKKNKNKKRIVTLLISSILAVCTVSTFTVHAGLFQLIKSAIESLTEEENNTIEEGVEDEVMTFLNEIMALTDEECYVDAPDDDEKDETSVLGGFESENVWWSPNNRQMSALTYQLTDWTEFDGLMVSLHGDSSTTALLSDEVKKYEDVLDAAANAAGIGLYKELFKALAEERHDKDDLSNKDFFQMVNSSLNTKNKTSLTVKQSAELAATLLAECLEEANYPDQYDTDALACVVQAFEFDEINAGYVDYCDGDYSKESAEEYANEKSNGTLREDAAEASAKGPYEYHDQYYPPKVFQYYSVIYFDETAMTEEEKQLLKEAQASWSDWDDLDGGRFDVIEKGLSLFGKVRYSQEQRLQPSIDNPNYLDCSSFVAWSYYQAGYTSIPVDGYTGTFVEKAQSGVLTQISESELRPGDICLKNASMAGGNSNHALIYLGESSSGQHIFLHCTRGGSVDGITISCYSNAHVFYKYTAFSN